MQAVSEGNQRLLVKGTRPLDSVGALEEAISEEGGFRGVGVTEYRGQTGERENRGLLTIRE